MVKFTKDTVVQPIITEWFGFYKENDLNSTYTLQDSALYLEVCIHLNILTVVMLYKT